MLEPGKVVLAFVQFTDTFEVKKRPAVVLYEEFGNVIVAGITSNKDMEGIPLLREEGAVKDSVIKLNYIFTIHKRAIEKELFLLSLNKRELIFNELNKRLSLLKKFK